jgi:hypothetical protein
MAVALTAILLVASCASRCPEAIPPPGEVAADRIEAALIAGTPMDAGDSALVAVVLATEDGGSLLPRSIWKVEADTLPPADSSGPLASAEAVESPGLYAAVFDGDPLATPPDARFYYVRRLADPRRTLGELVNDDGAYQPATRAHGSGALSVHLPYPSQAGLVFFEVREGPGGLGVEEVHGYVPPLPDEDRPPECPMIRLEVRR